MTLSNENGIITDGWRIYYFGRVSFGCFAADGTSSAGNVMVD